MAANGHELWISDGTFAGTYKPSFSNMAGYDPVLPSYDTFTVFNGSLYFTARYGNYNWELYKLTLPLTDVAGLASSGPGGFTNYPNPASGYLVLRTSHPSTFSICSITGQTLMHLTITRDQQIDVSGFAPGIYLIPEEATGLTQKWVKE